MGKKQFYLFGILLVIIILTVTAWIVKIINGNIPYIDQWTGGFVESFADTNVYTIARLVTELGSQSFLIPFTIVVGLLIWFGFRDWLPAIIFSGGTLVSHLANMFIKALVARERPRIYIEANAEGYSFPSGHAMISMVCYGLLMYLLVKKISSIKLGLLLQISFALLIFLIGMSRYVINVHYLTDVLTGFMVGFIILVGFIALFEYVQSRRSRKYS